MFGPTVGDRVKLADMNLWIEIEKDYTVHGDECKFGGGKVLRDGCGQASNRSDSEVLDLVITNALIIDWSGIIKVSPLGKVGTDCVRPILESKAGRLLGLEKPEILTIWME